MITILSIQKNWEKNIDELIDYLQEFKKTERKKKIESDAEFYEFYVKSIW